MDDAAGDGADGLRGGGGEPSPRHSKNPAPQDEREQGRAGPPPAESGRMSETRSVRGASTRAGGGGGSSYARGDDGRGSGAEVAAAATAAAACEECAGSAGDERVDKELLDGFGIIVCRACKVDHFQSGRSRMVSPAHGSKHTMLKCCRRDLVPM